MPGCAFIFCAASGSSPNGATPLLGPCLEDHNVAKILTRLTFLSCSVRQDHDHCQSRHCNKAQGSQDFSKRTRVKRRGDTIQEVDTDKVKSFGVVGMNIDGVLYADSCDSEVSNEFYYMMGNLLKRWGEMVN